MISSPEIDKLLRRYLSPILRENGFTKVSARKAWGWKNKCISVLQVRAVGSYFSAVTGWPPMSVGVWTGVYYDFIPCDGRTPPKRDEKGRLAPDEASCHMRSDLSCSLDQSHFTHQLSNPAEHSRTDIWWFERDGSNMVDAVENVALCFVDQGISWFQRYNDLDAAFADIELERDCYVKYYRASYLAKELGLETKHRMYAELRDVEKTRIDAMFPV
jgi:hypothetical protein